jgi:hypothetical protein
MRLKNSGNNCASPSAWPKMRHAKGLSSGGCEISELSEVITNSFGGKDLCGRDFVINCEIMRGNSFSPIYKVHRGGPKVPH